MLFLFVHILLVSESPQHLLLQALNDQDQAASELRAILQGLPAVLEAIEM